MNILFYSFPFLNIASHVRDAIQKSVDRNGRNIVLSRMEYDLP